jgi:hypothetical protein
VLEDASTSGKPAWRLQQMVFHQGTYGVLLLLNRMLSMARFRDSLPRIN